MSDSSLNAFWSNFLGESPNWYKQTIIGFIVINPILLMVAGPVVTGWTLIGEFIFTLALALRCYPLQPGGLLAIEGILLGLADPHSVFHEAEANFEVILLLMFMVAGIYFMKDLLLFVFTKILLNVRSKKLLAFNRLCGTVGISRCADGDGSIDQCRCWFLCRISPGCLGHGGH
jgi:NhaB family Na+:H+ antiporter